MQHYDDIRGLIERVRARWRALSALHAAVRAALAAAAALGLGLIVARWAENAPRTFALIALVAVILALAALVWALLPLRRVPSDLQVARFIEERAPSLDDRLVSAVDVAGSPRQASHTLVEPMLADAARRARDVEVDSIVPAGLLRRAGWQAAAAAIVLLVVLFAGRGPAKQAVDARLAVAGARHARGHARQRANQGRFAPGDPGAAGRQPRAGRRAGADRGRRRVASERDDDRFAPDLFDWR